GPRGQRRQPNVGPAVAVEPGVAGGKHGAAGSHAHRSAPHPRSDREQPDGNRPKSTAGNNEGAGHHGAAVDHVSRKAGPPQARAVDPGDGQLPDGPGEEFARRALARACDHGARRITNLETGGPDSLAQAIVVADRADPKLGHPSVAESLATEGHGAAPGKS